MITCNVSRTSYTLYFQLQTQSFLIPIKSNNQSLFWKGFLLQYFLTKKREIRKTQSNTLCFVKLTIHNCLLHKQVILVSNIDLDHDYLCVVSFFPKKLIHRSMLVKQSRIALVIFPTGLTISLIFCLITWDQYSFFLVVSEVRTPDLAYIMHCPYQLSWAHGGLRSIFWLYNDNAGFCQKK